MKRGCGTDGRQLQAADGRQTRALLIRSCGVDNPACIRRNRVKMFTHLIHRRIQGSRPFNDAGGRIGISADKRLVLAHNAGFFKADRFPVATQPILMIQGDTGNHSNIGLDDISGIQAATQAYFQQYSIERLLLKDPKRRQSGEFEIG